MAKTERKIEIQSPNNQNFGEIPLWGVILIFVGTVLVFFGGHIFGNYFLWDDFREYFFPTQSFAASELANGRIPFWNPYNFGGMPFLADIQVGFWYPFNRLLGLSIGHDGMVSPWFYQIILFLHFFIMQINFYTFAKYLKISSYGAIIGAIAFSYSHPIFFHTIHPAIVFHWAWFPLIFYFIKRSFDERKIKFAALSGLILGITTLSGHPQITFYFFLIFCLFIAWHFFSGLIQKKNEIKGVIITTFFGILSIILAILIFSIQFLPSNTLSKHSMRSEMNYEKSSENSLKYEQIFTLLAPRLFGYFDADNQTEFQPILKDEYNGKQEYVKNYYYWETAVFFGSVALLLAIIGIFVTKIDNFKLFLIVLILFGFFYSLGKHFPLHQLMYNLPFFDIFRNPVRMFVFSIFGLSIFAGYAFDNFFKNVDKKLINRILIIAGILLLLSFFNVSGISQSISGLTDENVSKSTSLSVLTFAMLLISSLAIYATYKFKLPKIFTFLVILVSLVIELYFEGIGFIQSKIDPKTIYELPDETIKAFRPTTPQSDQFRVKTRIYNPSFMAMNRNQGMISRIYQLEGYNPLVLNKASLPVPWEQVFELLNVRYDIQINPQTGQPQFVEITKRNGNAWFVRRAKFVDQAKAKEFLENNTIDFSQEVIIHTNRFDETKYQTLLGDTLDINPKIRLINYTPNHIIYEVDTPKDGILVFSEIYYPDWKATINEKEVPILIANNSLRAIEVPKGIHKIEMTYHSNDFETGKYLAILGLIIGLVLIIVNKNKE
mgnify:CR=1 FL=1